jgi:hypothetical protein
MSIEMQAREKIHQTSFNASNAEEEKLIKMSNLGFSSPIFLLTLDFLI